MKYIKNKNLIGEAGAIYGQGNESDTKYFSGSLFDALLLEDNRILTIDKESIKKDFCFGERGYDFDEKLKMSIDARNFDFFKRENTAQIIEDIERIKEALEQYEEEGEYKPILFFYKTFYPKGKERLTTFGIQDKRHWTSRRIEEFNDARLASKKEIENLLFLKKAQLEEMEKRLVSWWKRYGAEKLNTWTYWADA